LWQVNFGLVVARIGEEPLERVFQRTLEEVIRELEHYAEGKDRDGKIQEL
jgi:hypothetical protein